MEISMHISRILVIGKMMNGLATILKPFISMKRVITRLKDRAHFGMVVIFFLIQNEDWLK